MAAPFTLKLLPLYRAIDPMFTLDVENRFKKIYGSDGRRGSDILRHRLGFMSFLVTKDKLKLEPPIIETIKIKTPDSDKYKLEEVKKEMLAFVEKQVAYYTSRKEEDKAFFFECIEHYKGTLRRQEDYVELNEYLEYIELIKKTPPMGLGYIKEQLRFCNLLEKNKIIPSLNDKATKEKFIEVKSLYKYMILKIQGECLGRILGKRRMECYQSMLAYIDFSGIINSTNKKTVIFSSFVDVIDKADELIKEKGYTPLIVYGKTTNELAQIVGRFEKEEQINPLLATFKSLSTAVPLIMADTVIMIDPPFREYILTQAISRVHRLGADTQTYIYMTELDTGEEPNLSNRTVDILKWSQEEVSNILGVPSTYNLEGTETSDSVSMEEFVGLNVEFNSVLKHANPIASW